MSTLFITNDHGVPLAVRLVRKGDRYGLYGRLTHDIDDPLVEFYDTRYDSNGDWLEYFTGTFVSRYYRSTLLERPGGGGMALMGEAYYWQVSASNMAQIKEWLREVDL